MSNCNQFRSGQIKSEGSPALSGTWTIYNDIGRQVKIGWIDYNGLVPNNGFLAAGSSMSIPANHTYTRHPFLVSELNGECYGYLYPTVGRVTISSSRGIIHIPIPVNPPLSPPEVYNREEPEEKPVDVNKTASEYMKREEEEKEEEKETSYMWLWIVLAVVVFFIFGIVGVILMTKGGGEVDYRPY